MMTDINSGSHGLSLISVGLLRLDSPDVMQGNRLSEDGKSTLIIIHLLLHPQFGKDIISVLNES